MGFSFKEGRFGKIGTEIDLSGGSLLIQRFF
jgi:hypothetical protein